MLPIELAKQCISYSTSWDLKELDTAIETLVADVKIKGGVTLRGPLSLTSHVVSNM